MTSSSDDSSSLRLQKFLASAGVGSRRHCEELILAGKVCVDGKVAMEPGTKVDPDRQKIEVNGDYLKREPKRYYLLNKPPGYLCTNNDPAGRPRVVDLISHEHYRLFPVGRLDENSCGLLLITNDGELANRLAHPRYRITRTYSVQVAGRPTPETLRALRTGMWFTEGLFKVSRVKQIRRKGNSTVLEVDLHEGKNREVRRLFARVGHKVMHLQRIRFGPVRLGRLALGKYRPLTKIEFDQLKALLDNPVDAAEKSFRKPGSGKPAPKRKPVSKTSASSSATRKKTAHKKTARKSSPRADRDNDRTTDRTRPKKTFRKGSPKRGVKKTGEGVSKRASKTTPRKGTGFKAKSRPKSGPGPRPKFKTKLKSGSGLQAQEEFDPKAKPKPKQKKPKTRSKSKKAKEKMARNAGKKLAKKNKAKKRKK